MSHKVTTDHEVVGNVEESKLSDLSKHLLECNKHLEVARKNWNTRTREFKYTGSKGIYIIRGFKFAPNVGLSTLADMKYEWPNAFVNSESQPVCGAVFYQGTEDVSYSQSILACIWTFSPTGDETNEFYLKEYEKDMSELMADYEMDPDVVTDPMCLSAFDVSSGDEAIHDFYCPALDVLEEQDAGEVAAHELTFLKGANLTKRKRDD